MLSLFGLTPRTRDERRTLRLRPARRRDIDEANRKFQELFDLQAAREARLEELRQRRPRLQGDDLAALDAAISELEEAYEEGERQFAEVGRVFDSFHAYETPRELKYWASVAVPRLHGGRHRRAPGRRSARHRGSRRCGSGSRASPDDPHESDSNRVSPLPLGAGR
jgi:hypothetical protein